MAGLIALTGRRTSAGRCEGFWERGGFVKAAGTAPAKGNRSNHDGLYTSEDSTRIQVNRVGPSPSSVDLGFARSATSRTDNLHDEDAIPRRSGDIYDPVLLQESLEDSRL